MPPLDRDLAARTAVLHASRAHLADLVDLARECLQGRKAVTDVLTIAHSIPAVNTEDAKWLASQWSATLDMLCGYRTLDTDVLRARGLFAAIKDDIKSITDTQPIYTLFDSISEFCATVYGPEWRYKPTLRTKTLTTHPGRGPGFNDPYAVTARTDRTTRPAEVTLKVYLPEFGPATFAVLPRLLLHEVFCHTNVGHRPEDVRADSVFAEGWLDWAAQHHFPYWLDKADSAWAPSARRHSSALLEEFGRRDRTTGPTRKYGHEAAGALCRWLERNGGAQIERPDTKVARLAVAVAVHSAPLTEKDTLTRKVMTPDQDLIPTLQEWDAGAVGAHELLAAAIR